MLLFSRFLCYVCICVNDVKSKSYYTSVISFLLNGFITLQHCVLYEKHVFLDMTIIKQILNHQFE